MSDVLQTGLQWLSDQLDAKQSRTIAYSRQGKGSTTFLATKGRKLLRVSDGAGGFRMVWTGADYTVATAAFQAFFGTDLVSGKPLKGDVITDGGKTYEVGAPDNEPHYQLIDMDLRLRIHAKQVG
jgi:hypothetical protein